MSTKAYYKTNAPEVMDVLKVHNDECQVIGDAGRKFAEHFGGVLLVRNSVHGYSVAGLRFNPKKDTRLWTCPGDSGEQRPRQSITKATAEEKEQLASLKADWKENLPTTESSFDPVMTAMGTDWGSCAFSGGFRMFEHDGFAYVATGSNMASCMVEILGSEFGAAETAFDAQRKADREQAAKAAV